MEILNINVKNQTPETEDIKYIKYKYSKDIYLAVKQEIKKRASLQAVYKIRRKASNSYTDIPPPLATRIHAVNRNAIRTLHILYDHVRGKDSSILKEEYERLPKSLKITYNNFEDVFLNPKKDK